MDINIKLEAFEGPFDLLFHLIEKNKINIYDIPISDLTQQYLEYIDKMHQLDLDTMSQFLVMASTLIEIKSKMLLPSSKGNESEQQDPRVELVNRLIEYKKYKAVTEKLAQAYTDMSKVFFKHADIEIENLKRENQNTDLSDILNGISLIDIMIAFEEVIKRKEKKVDRVRSKFNSIQKDVYTIEQKSELILDMLSLYKTIKFKNIFDKNTDKLEMITTFLALLELIKLKKVVIYQNSLFDDIVITEFSNFCLQT